MSELNVKEVTKVVGGVVHNINVATANTIYQAPYMVTITIAQYTGESSHD